MLSNERIVLVDLDTCDEVEYRGYVVTRMQPRSYFFTITPNSGATSLAPPGAWTSAKEAIAAIDELLGEEGRATN